MFTVETNIHDKGYRPGFAKRISQGHKIVREVPKELKAYEVQQAIALGLSDLPPQERDLLQYYSAYINLADLNKRKTSVWPSSRLTCQLLGISGATLRRYKASLEHKGFIQRCYDRRNRPLEQGAIDLAPLLSQVKGLLRHVQNQFELMRLLLKKGRTLRDMCKFYHLDEHIHRNLLLLMHSLLIRNPANRFKYESHPKMFGLPPDEEVGKANMIQDYRIARKLCQTGSITNQYFVLLHSPLKKFICGDGSLDWLTSGLITNRIDGRMLMPLTPHLCVYFCTPVAMRSTPNCASFNAVPWMVDWVNEVTQIYSKDKLFFLGKAPS